MKTNITFDVYDQTMGFKALYAEKLKIKHPFSFFNSLSNLLYLTVKDSSQSEFCSAVFNMKKLISVDMSHNSISYLQKKCLSEKAKVRVILLNTNLLCDISKSNLFQAEFLSIVNLSHNLLASMDVHSVIARLNLSVLSFKNNCIATTGSSSLSQFDVQFLEADDYKMCCLLRHRVKCFANWVWYKVCDDLLPGNALKAVFYVISTLVLAVNATSIAFHCKLDRKAPFVSIVFGVCSSNIVFSLEIFILWISDLYFQEYFVFSEETVWKSGFWCWATHFIQLKFTTQSPLNMALMSFARRDVVVKPLNSKFKHLNHVVKRVLLLSCVAFLCFLSHNDCDNICDQLPCCNPNLITLCRSN